MPVKRPAPAKLGKRGRRLWDAITGNYELRPDELELLADAVREADLIERMAEEMQGQPLLVEGSYGQQVANPLLAELRQHRACVASLLKALKIPDEPDTANRKSTAVTEAARKAANVRWARTGPGA